jgi:hypothetical protein
MKFASLALAASAATFVNAEYTRCALEKPAADVVAELADAARIGAANQEISRVASRNVPVYVHVVTTSAKQGRYSQTMINNQIATMNDAYSGMGITFSLKSTDFTVNSAWAAADLGSTAERNMKAALKKGRYSELDLYFATDIPGGTLGWYEAAYRVFRNNSLTVTQVLLPQGEPFLVRFDIGRLRQPGRFPAWRFCYSFQRRCYGHPRSWPLAWPLPRLPGWLHRYWRPSLRHATPEDCLFWLPRWPGLLHRWRR